MVNITGRAKIETVSADLKHKYGLLESALSTVLQFLFLTLLCHCYCYSHMGIIVLVQFECICGE